MAVKKNSSEAVADVAPSVSAAGGLLFVDPPAAATKVRGISAESEALVAGLKANKGKWAKVYEGATRWSCPVFLRGWDFERAFRGETVNGKMVHTGFVRYVGEEGIKAAAAKKAAAKAAAESTPGDGN